MVEDSIHSTCRLRSACAKVEVAELQARHYVRMASLFALIAAPMFAVAWWLNREALVFEIKHPTWLPYGILLEHPIAVIALAVITTTTTAIISGRAERSRQRRPIMVSWFPLLGLLCAPVLLLFTQPAFFTKIPLQAFPAAVLVALLTGILPFLVGVVISLCWLVVSQATLRRS